MPLPFPFLIPPYTTHWAVGDPRILTHRRYDRSQTVFLHAVLVGRNDMTDHLSFLSATILSLFCYLALLLSDSSDFLFSAVT